jgi:uncharacterized protein
LDFSDKRIISALRVLAFVLAYSAAIALIVVFSRFLPSKAVDVVTLLLSVALPLALVICFRVLVDRQPIQSLGLESTSTWAYEMASGFAVAAVLASAVFIAGSSFGWLTFRGHLTGGMLNVTFIGVFIYFFASTAVVAFGEEFMFRGYIQANIKEGWGVPAAIGVSSVLFSLGHVLNPGFSWLVAVNLVLAGVLLAYATAITGNIWWAAGFHTAWNFFEGSIFGFPVSGATTGSLSVFITKIQAPAWVMGGRFGPEGGAVATAAFLTGIGLLWIFGRARKGQEDAGAA